MEKNYIVEYELHYEGGSKSNHTKTISIDDVSPENVLSKIRESKNVNQYVIDISILNLIEQ